MVSPHPIPAVRDLLFPRRLKATCDLLNNPGLELTYNARGALLRACTEIASFGKREILVPAFHCPSGITPAIKAGLTPVFYRIRRDLKIDYEDLLSKTSPHTGAVLIIHFFGMAADLYPLNQLRESGIVLIEDWSHSFIQGEPPRLSGTDSDYRVYSFWKLVPSGVGGGLMRGSSRNKQWLSQSVPLMQQAVNFKQLFEEAINHSGYRLARAAFSQLERARLAFKTSPSAIHPVERIDIRGEDHYPFDLRLAGSTMPAFAKKIIASSDLEKVTRRRRTNFSLYGKLLSSFGPLQVLYPDLPEEACPWVFPVLLQSRDKIDHLWRGSGIALHTFGIYLHSALLDTTDNQTIQDANFLAENILCLAIHQGITECEIEVSAKIIRSTLHFTS